MKRLLILLMCLPFILGSREFNGTTGRIQGASAVVTDEPLTMSAWVYPTTMTGARTIFSLNTAGSINNVFYIGMLGDTAGDPVFASCKDTADDFAQSATGLTVNTWGHVAGVFRGAADRSVFLNGVITNNTGTCNPTAPDRTTIGSRGSGAQFWAGRIAEVAVWNTDLSNAEIASLAAGFSPLLIRPQNLVFYAPLIGEITTETDIVGGLALTHTGSPTRAGHTRVFNAD